MKTKIIYISGNEIFSMADIRAAFDEVRTALGLGTDTVMFGVPVDADDALATPVNAENHDSDTIDTVISTQNESPKTPIEQSDPINTPVIMTTEQIQPEADAHAEKSHKAAAKRGRTRAKAVATADTETAPDVIADADQETVDVADTRDTTPAPEMAATTSAAIDDATADTAAPVIPILSVLASKNTVEAAPIEPAVTDVALPDITDDTPANAADNTISDTAEPLISDIEIDAPVIAADTDDADADMTLQRVTIEDMITDDAPVVPAEKTLEQLLESMTPLREDHGDIAQDAAPVYDAMDELDTDFEIPQTSDDTDATLAQLATEFAQNEDKIIGTPKPESHGKIGKLKNILPFKKVKRDDTGLMGDLFGWAGIAANDEDFSIPGFFTTAASKK